jgi:ribosomal protein L40E
MSATLVCWKCGADISHVPQPLGRRAECDACHAELHVCRMCRHYDPGKAKQCREPMVEEIRDKEHANFCEWFQPRKSAHLPGATGRPATRQALEALFGGEDGGQGSRPAATTGEPGSDLDRLFGD